LVSIDADSLCLGRGFFSKQTLNRDRHLAVVASDPAIDSKRIVVVNVSTKPCPCGKACVVNPNEHAALSETSYIRCDYANVTSFDALKAGFDGGVVTMSKTVSSALLARIQERLLRSVHTRREIKAILTEQGFG
jgi:hypothetical protein